MTISSPPVAPPTAPRRRRSRPTRRRVGMLVAAVASVLAGSTPSSAAPQVELASVTPTGTAIEPVSLIDVKLHILIEGGRFDIKTRTATPE